jgi:hypothetical protein
MFILPRRRKKIIQRFFNARSVRHLIEWVTAHAMTEREGSDAAHVCIRHLTPTFQRSKRAPSTRNRQLASVAVYFESQTKLCDAAQKGARQFYFSKSPARPYQPAAQALLRRLCLSAECGRVVLETLTPLNDLNAPVQIVHGPDFDIQAEAVEQLRSKLAFLRIA